MIASVSDLVGWIVSGTLFVALAIWAVLDARKVDT